MTKTCQRCKQEKEISNYPKNKHSKDGYGGYCKECKNKIFPSKLYIASWRIYYQNNKEKIKQYARDYYKTHKDRKREIDLRKYYNLSVEEYNSLFFKQMGLCAICGQKKKLHIDHNHITGKVRGLLCNGCNRGIGFLGEDKNILNKAIDYINSQ